MKTRDSCQPSQALKPSSSEKSFDDDDDNQGGVELFVSGSTRKYQEKSDSKGEAGCHNS